MSKSGVNKFEVWCLKKLRKNSDVYYYSSLYMKHIDFIQATERQTFY